MDDRRTCNGLVEKMRLANPSENNNYRWQNLISAKHCQRLIQQLRRSSSFLVSFDVEGYSRILS